MKMLRANRGGGVGIVSIRVRRPRCLMMCRRLKASFESSGQRWELGGVKASTCISLLFSYVGLVRDILGRPQEEGTLEHPRPRAQAFCLFVEL